MDRAGLPGGGRPGGTRRRASAQPPRSDSRKRAAANRSARAEPASCGLREPGRRPKAQPEPPSGGKRSVKPTRPGRRGRRPVNQAVLGAFFARSAFVRGVTAELQARSSAERADCRAPPSFKPRGLFRRKSGRKRKARRGSGSRRADARRHGVLLRCVVFLVVGSGFGMLLTLNFPARHPVSHAAGAGFAPAADASGGGEFGERTPAPIGTMP